MIQFLNLKEVTCSRYNTTMCSITDLNEASRRLVAAVVQRCLLVIKYFRVIGLHLSYKAQVDFPIVSYIGIIAKGSIARAGF